MVESWRGVVVERRASLYKSLMVVRFLSLALLLEACSRLTKGQGVAYATSSGKEAFELTDGNPFATALAEATSLSLLNQYPWPQLGHKFQPTDLPWRWED